MTFYRELSKCAGMNAVCGATRISVVKYFGHVNVEIVHKPEQGEEGYDILQGNLERLTGIKRLFEKLNKQAYFKKEPKTTDFSLKFVYRVNGAL